MHNECRYIFLGSLRIISPCDENVGYFGKRKVEVADLIMKNNYIFVTSNEKHIA